MENKERQLYRITYFWQDDYIIVRWLSREQVNHAFCKTVKQWELQDDDDWTFFLKLEDNIESLGGEIDFFLNCGDNELVDLNYMDNDTYSEYSLTHYGEKEE